MADTLKSERASAENVQKALDKQISELRREIGRINKSISDRSGEILDEARQAAAEAYQTAPSRAARAARQLRTQAHSVSEAARANPRTMTALLGAVGLLGFILGAAAARISSDPGRRWR